MNVLQFLAFGSLAVACSAHLCLLGPAQRGSMQNINDKGSNDCVLTSGPCGGRSAGSNPTYYKPGETVTVTFQKNLDHWARATPGNFTVSLMMESSSTALVMSTVPDKGEPSLTLYTTTLTIPQSAAKGAYVIQVVYNTNNPHAPAQFFQCADVMLENMH